MRIIGVTGSKGKTTTAWLIRSILRASGYRVGMLGTIEYDFEDGVKSRAHHTTPGPEAMNRYFEFMRERGCDFCVMELASASFTDDRLRDLSLDALAVTCCLRGYHVREHSDFLAYKSCKLKALAHVRDNGFTVLNADDDEFDNFHAFARGKRVTVGMESERADYTARLEGSSLLGSRIMVSTDPPIAYQSHLFGRHQARNAVMAAAVCAEFDAPPASIWRGLTEVRRVPARMERVAHVDGVSVYLDHSHPVAACEASLAALRGYVGGKGRILVVFGWGSDRECERRRGFGRVLDRYADRVIFTADSHRNEDPRIIAEQIRDGMSDPFKSRWIADREAAVRYATFDANPGDVVLVAGRGIDLPLEVGGGYARIESDRVMIRDAARRRAA